MDSSANMITTINFIRLYFSLVIDKIAHDWLVVPIFCEELDIFFILKRKKTDNSVVTVERPLGNTVKLLKLQSIEYETYM